MKATIDYIKYSIYDTYAVVNGYDQRKKEERVMNTVSIGTCATAQKANKNG